MTKEQLRMQMLAGIITESEYVAVINKEIEEADKASLNESMIGGIVGIGAINQIPPREKTDYEMAYEHYLNSNPLNEDETSEMEDEVETEVSMNEEYDGLNPDDYDLMDDGSMMDPETGKIVWSPERGRIKEEEVEEPNNY